MKFAERKLDWSVVSDEFFMSFLSIPTDGMKKRYK